jgi:uncharacterized membrane protein
VKDNKIQVLTVRFQVYIFLIATISAGIVGLYLRDDSFVNPKVLMLLTFGLAVIIVFTILVINNYIKTDKLLNKDKK